ncbi:MAG: hypothetical protein HYX51_03860 [Chloroflexi bacterium]|nr:hypothetical protein [Chloroflexota bacterium]
MSELDDETLDEEPDVRAWLESAARVMIMEHVGELRSRGVGDRESGVGEEHATGDGD